jgi:hypothetical protein
MAKEELGAEGWQVETEDIQDSYEEAHKKLKQGVVDDWVIFTLLKYSMTPDVYTYAWETDDNALLGVQQFTHAEVKSIVREIAKSSN